MSHLYARDRLHSMVPPEPPTMRISCGTVKGRSSPTRANRSTRRSPSLPPNLKRGREGGRERRDSECVQVRESATPVQLAQGERVQKGQYLGLATHES